MPTGEGDRATCAGSFQETAVAMFSRSPPILNMSTRQFERRFLTRVGLSPKLFCRIQRFSHVFQVFEAGRNWAQAAVECGYYDQAHLVKNFREFSGDAPSQLLAGDEFAITLNAPFSKTTFIKGE
jgi:methylphosphotriester-DNA--protein-cysteine methyltransferase